MTKIKMSPKRGSVHLLQLETFHTMLRRKKKKSFSINSADDRYVIIKYNWLEDANVGWYSTIFRQPTFIFQFTFFLNHLLFLKDHKFYIWGKLFILNFAPY